MLNLVVEQKLPSGLRWLCYDKHTYIFHSEGLEPSMLEKSHISAKSDEEGMFMQNCTNMVA